ncbi:MAG TPA: hypothetical protein VGM82_00965 [Gemmatimonadaceae bacterium]|jgi:hypothetical protein
MGFREDWARASQRALARQRALFVNTASRVYESIVNGSAVTGAPGQPVDTGFLRTSWILEFVDKDTARISTKCVYASVIEDNLRGAVFKNRGPHSVKLTKAGFAQLVAYERAKLGAGDGGN